MASALPSTAGLNLASHPNAFDAAPHRTSSPTIIATPPKSLLFQPLHHRKHSLAAVAPTPLPCKATADQPMSSEGSEGIVFSTRRSMLSLVAATVGAGAIARGAYAAPSEIKVGGPPLPFGGLPGTENADQARDLELPLKDRFFLQVLTPAEAVSRVKDSAEDIVGVKGLIAKKAWPYVQNDLRNRASYLRFDLNTIISSKPREEKKSLKALTSKLFEVIDKLDYAARSKSLPQAEKYYEETVTALNTVISKIA